MPHLTGKDFLAHYKIPSGSPMAYALTSEDFAALARNYGRMGGFDRIARVIKSIRAERGDNRCLLLDGGDTWTNSWTALQTKAADVVQAMNLLKPDAMTGHWEFTLGADRVKEIVDSLPFPFLAQNVRETDFEDRVFEPQKVFERGGVKVAVIGQAYPYTASPIHAGCFRNGPSASRMTMFRKKWMQRGRQGPNLLFCCLITASISTGKWPVV